MGKSIRSFIAIPIPETILKAIAEAQETLKEYDLGIRWVRKEGIHLTLKFLGNIGWDDVEGIQVAMKQAAEPFSPFAVRGEGIGAFPDLKRPRVIWVGVSGEVQVVRALQRELESRLNGLGFPREKRAFKGHLTLGRVKGRLEVARLAKALEALEGFRTDSFTVQSVVLFQSDLRPNGAVYSRLAEVLL